MANENEREEKKGLSLAEKEAQLEQSVAKQTGDTGDDDAIFNPEPVPFQIAGKTYQIIPLSIEEMRYMIRLSKVDLAKIDSSALDTVIECFSAILKEPDTSFLEKNIRIPMMLKLFNVISRVNYSSIPSAKKTDKKSAGD